MQAMAAHHGSLQGRGRGWRRTPPAIFPVVMGLYGLGLAWREGADAFGLPAGVAELILGAVAMLHLGGAAAYAAKLAARPGALGDDLRTLPGRAGTAGFVLCFYLLALAIRPFAPEAAAWIAAGTVLLHLAYVAVFVAALVRLPAEQRMPGPVWHLVFASVIIGALALAATGRPAAAGAMFWMAVAAAIPVWVAGAVALVRGAVPAPMRPTLAIHLSPVAVMGNVAVMLGWDQAAAVCGALSAAVLAALALSGRWLTAAGFSPLWGSFTFPLAATAALWLRLGGGWGMAGALALVAATLVIPPIALRILRGWISGDLAARTNAAAA
jgi:tellurite resistance protein